MRQREWEKERKREEGGIEGEQGKEGEREREGAGAISVKMVISAHEKTLEEIKGHFLENCKRRGWTGRIRFCNSSEQKIVNKVLLSDTQTT